MTWKRTSSLCLQGSKRNRMIISQQVIHSSHKWNFYLVNSQRLFNWAWGLINKRDFILCAVNLVNYPWLERTEMLVETYYCNFLKPMHFYLYANAYSFRYPQRSVAFSLNKEASSFLMKGFMVLVSEKRTEMIGHGEPNTNCYICNAKSILKLQGTLWKRRRNDC